MPFTSTDELPDEVREALSEDEQESWLEVFNEVLDRGDSERKAFRIAWSVVQNERGREAPIEADAEVADVDISELPQEAARLRKVMREAERSALKRVRQIAIDHQRAFKRYIRDAGSMNGPKMKRLGQQLEQKFKPRYREAVRDLVNEVRHEAARVTIEENGLEGLVSLEDLPTGMVRNIQFEDSLSIVIENIADELYNRQQGNFEEQMSEVERQTADGERQRQGVDRLSDSTLEGILDKAGGPAMNEGRDDVSAEADDKSGDQRIYKVRTSVLDSNTCGPCRDLDGKRVVAGSKNEKLYQPPAYCKGRDKCRCYYKMEFPDSFDLGAQGVPARWRCERSGDETPTSEKWIKLFSWGEVDHPQGTFEVDRQFVAELVRAFKYLKRRHGYKPPILQKHQRDGFRYGKITDVTTRSDGVYGKPDWIDPVRPLVDQGAIDYISPGFDTDWTDQHTGEEFGVVLREVSFVSDGHLLNIGPLSETALDPVELEAQYPLDDAYYALQKEQPMPHNENDETTENADVEAMPGGASKFGRWLDEMLERASLPESMGGPTRQERIDELEQGGNDGAVEKLVSGEMMLPPDGLVEQAAEVFGVSASAIRSGEALQEVGGEKEEGDGEQGPEVDRLEADEEMQDDEPADVQNGPQLAGTLQDAIASQTEGEDGGTREEILGKIAGDAALDKSTVGSVVSGDITCPRPGFFGAASTHLSAVSADELRAAAEADGCEYSTENADEEGGETTELAAENKRLREKVTRYELKDQGVPESKIDELVELRDESERAYEMAVETITDVELSAKSGEGDGAEEGPIDEEQGSAGTTTLEAKADAEVRRLCAKARDKEIKPGRPVLRFLENQGVDPDAHDELGDIIRETYRIRQS